MVTRLYMHRHFLPHSDANIHASLWPMSNDMINQTLLCVKHSYSGRAGGETAHVAGSETHKIGS